MPNDPAALNEPTPDPDGETENQMGEEPAEESGGGYGNHAAPDVAAEPTAPDKDAR